jgi:hypothetical protein
MRKSLPEFSQIRKELNRPEKLVIAGFTTSNDFGSGDFDSELINRQPLELVDSSIGKRVPVLTSSGYEIDDVLVEIGAPCNGVLSDANKTRP